MTVLVTGGAGFIGSHAVLALLQQNYRVIALDNLCNSSALSLRRVERLAGKPISLIVGDVRDSKLLDKIFSENQIDTVFHFAGLKAVGESTEKPLLYYDNNVTGSLSLVQAMEKASVFNLVFSSTAAVYGQPKENPVSEQYPTNPTNPYSYSKLVIEQILQDLAKADSRWSVALLRYFNPVGAHPSGQIGEDPNNTPNNLLPYISQVAVGLSEKLSVFGNDYPTRDGTGIRDYIHVVDLVNGHLAARRYLDTNQGCHIWNLGIGKGYSVLEMIRAFEQVSGVQLPYEIVPRRAGDVAQYWANAEKAQKELHWKPTLGLQDIMRDVWRWKKRNPFGYEILEE